MKASSSYDQGFNAHMCGKECRENPFAPGTDDHNDWAQGWRDREHHMRMRDECFEW